MKKIILTGAFLFIALFSNAQNIEAKLKKDLVKIENYKMILEDLTLAKQDGTNVQIKAHCEVAESGIMSRDAFVYCSSEVISTILNTLIDDKTPTEDLEEIVGTPDIEINCYMAKSGIQVEIKIDGKTTKEMMKWSEVF